jgi:uncharacterized damage-inducible protein DinB
MSQDTQLREQLVEVLKGGHAHATFDQVIDGFPLDRIGERPAGMAHSAWELLEHLRIAQNDILRFSQSSDYREMKWPDDYWPKSSGPGDLSEWHKSVKAFRQDLADFEQLVLDPSRDLYRPFPWGGGQTLLREALLILDHNSHHLGQLLLVRRALERGPGVP